VSAVKRVVLFSVYCAAVLAVNGRIVYGLVDLSRTHDTASHHVLIPFITLALIFQGRDSIFSSVKSDWWGGLLVILSGVGLALAARQSGDSGTALTMGVAGIVLMWTGGFLLFWGREASRLALFPLLFLGFTIPIPTPLIDGAVRVLKAGSAEVVAGLFTITGTPYHRQGFVFSLPRLVIEIADECSGIRSSIALLLTGLLAGDQYLRTVSRKALVVLAVLPVAMVKNGIRIVSLSLLATYVDPGFITGQLHHEGGIVFFVLTLVMIAPLFLFLRSSETVFKG
jgi:exosortase